MANDSVCLSLGQLQRAIEIRIPCRIYRGFRWHSIVGLLVPWPIPAYLTSLWDIFQNSPQILPDAALCLRAGFPDGEGRQEWLSEALILKLYLMVNRHKKEKVQNPMAEKGLGIQGTERRPGQSEWVINRQRAKTRLEWLAEGSSYKEGVGFIQSAMGNNQWGLTRDVTIFVLFFKKGSLDHRESGIGACIMAPKYVQVLISGTYKCYLM